MAKRQSREHHINLARGIHIQHLPLTAAVDSSDAISTNDGEGSKTVDESALGRTIVEILPRGHCNGRISCPRQILSPRNRTSKRLTRHKRRAAGVAIITFNAVDE
jgi:hypothetical protein